MAPPPRQVEKPPNNMDAGTIGAVQNYLGLKATTVWDQDTSTAFRQFQQAKNWGLDFGVSGNQGEWQQLTSALANNDWTQVIPDRPTDSWPNDAPGPHGPGYGPGTGTGGGGSGGGGYGGGGGGGYTPNGSGQSGGGGGGNAAFEAELSASTERRINSAKADIATTLRLWNLEGLTDWAWNEIVNNNGEMLPVNIRDQQAYKDRFKGLEQRKAAGKNLISENEYVQLENNYTAIMHSYGLPRGLFDTPDYLGSLIAQDVSPSELNDRLRIYADAAFNAPKETRDALMRFYGVSEGGLMAYFIDPEKALPLLEQQYTVAGVTSAAERAGFTSFDQGEALRLAQLGAKASDTQTFASLRKATELFNPIGDEASGEITRNAAAEAAFGGNAGAQDLLIQRSDQRVAAFAGGGQVAATNRGAVGLGSGNS